MADPALVAKAEALKALHTSDELLVLCNTPDVALARVVEEAGFPAVATSSAGVAWTLGYADGENISRDEMLDMVRRVAAAVKVPVTADMEMGYGETPEAVAETVRRTAEAGAVGLNIEDGTHSDPPLLPFDLSVERIAAGRAAADEIGVPVVINARTDGFYPGASDDPFAESVKRGNAYLEAGADCVFVPFTRDAEVIGRLTKEIAGPVNVLAGAGAPTLPEMKELGISRVSIGGLLSLAAASLARRTAEELAGPGTYSFTDGIILHPEMNKLLSGN